ncbi:MAG: hypothetical protein OEV78_05550 [Spirochaetia bacterium]|nr:hypothetical protein [Spirochaetia bacterium]
MKVFRTLLAKELKLYFFGTSFYMVSSVLSIGLFLLFRFTYPSEQINMEIAVSVLWSVHMISSLFSLIASQEWEWEANALRAVKLSGVEGYIVFLTKSIASIGSMFLLWILEFLVWMVLYGGDIFKPSTGGYSAGQMTAPLTNMIFQLLVCGMLASIGIALIGQITSVLALHSRFRHVLMFIVFFPISIPLMISASSYSRLAVQLKGWSAGLNFLSLEAAFCLFFTAAGVILYDYLWEE